ncbi:class I SAM-dependent methyltransferase [Methylobacterium nigriterrae]|uniref:class I SAM-dependent methyltransferase n=1 Tax=Methylobacterium nigriterrae TaxID=3127512 RepID=UPI0030132307
MAGSFTAHNVVLDDGSQTLPERGWTLDKSPHVSLVHQIARMLFPEGIKGKRIVDLGCLEGGFATEFARLGLESTGIEVRRSNFENCMYIKERVSFDNLSFELDDAWNISEYGPFDIVFCVGLYYHIDRVTEFMHLLSQNARRALFLDTHFAPENDDSPSVATYNLSPLTQHEGIPGRWFPEHELETGSTALDQLKWASWDNRTSFWPTRAGILHLMRNSGFTTVFESFEQLGTDLISAMGKDGYYTTNTRSVFIGLKGG